MRSTLHRIIGGIIVIIVAILAFIVFQGLFRFLFLDMESRSLFLWDADEWLAAVSERGGLSVFLNGFLVQFFHIPILGTVLTSLVFTAIFSSVSESSSIWLGRDNTLRFWLSPIYLLPAALLGAEMVTSSYSLQAATDFLLVSICLMICTKAAERSRKGFWMTAVFSVAFLYYALVPDHYGKYGAADMKLIYAAYIFLPVTMAVSAAVGNKSAGMCISLSKGVFILVCSSVTWCLPLLKYVEKERRPRQEQLAQISYYARNGQWSYLLTVCRNIDMENHLLLNYANLAMSHQGILASHFTDFRQDSEKSLCVGSDMSAGSMLVQAMIYYQMGNIAAAQDMAFEANQYEYSPFLIQMLVKTNLIFGSYEVASRYIRILGKTLFYRDWASDACECMERLKDDGTVSSPLGKELLHKRALLPVTDAFIVKDHLISDLMHLLESAPDNVAARDYAVVSLILSHDASSLKTFVDRFYGTPVLPCLSKDMEMGLLVATNGDRDYCRRHGITDEMLRTYMNHKMQGK